MEDVQNASIPDAVNQEIRALEKVHIAGKSLMSRLDDLKVIVRADGTRLSDLLKPASTALDNLESSIEKLSKYGIHWPKSDADD